MHNRSWTLLAVLLVLASACVGDTAEGEGVLGRDTDVVAVVNGEEILKGPIDEATERIETILEEAELELDGVEFDEETAQQRILALLVEAEVTADLASNLGIEVDPAIVEETLERDRESMPTEERFQSRLAQANLTETLYREVVLPTRQRVTEIGLRLVEESDPVAVRNARVILVEEERDAQALLTEIEDGSEFSQLAFQHSIDLTSSSQGGYLGYQPRGAGPEPLDRAIWAEDVDAFFGPVETDQGWYVGVVASEDHVQVEDIPRSLWPDFAGELDALLTEAMSEASIEIDPRYGEWDADEREISHRS